MNTRTDQEDNEDDDNDIEEEAFSTGDRMGENSSETAAASSIEMRECCSAASTSLKTGSGGSLRTHRAGGDGHVHHVHVPNGQATIIGRRNKPPPAPPPPTAASPSPSLTPSPRRRAYKEKTPPSTQQQQRRRRPQQLYQQPFDHYNHQNHHQRYQNGSIHRHHNQQPQQQHRFRGECAVHGSMSSGMNRPVTAMADVMPSLNGGNRMPNRASSVFKLAEIDPVAQAGNIESSPPSSPWSPGR